MKENPVKKILRWIRKELTVPLFLFLLLFIASGIWVFWIIFKYFKPFIAMLLIIAAWNCTYIFNALENVFSSVPNYCRKCPGCNYYYPFIKQYVFKTFRKCAIPLRIATPEMESLIEAQPFPVADCLSRTFFTVMKLPDVTNRLSHPTICTLLTSNIDIFAMGTVLQERLIVDEIFEDDFSYTISVALVCTESHRDILRQKIAHQRQLELRKEEDEIYDERF